MTLTTEANNFDTPWKESLDVLFPYFMEYFHAIAYREIDWTSLWRPLEVDLRAYLRDSATGGRSVDKLMEVYRRDGVPGLVLVHVEVQGSRQPDFPRRMYTYHYRIEDRWNLPVASIAVLTDEQPAW